MFSGNKANVGGAIGGYVNITGGTNMFYGNVANNTGGAISSWTDGTFRATDGDLTFRGNRDGVGTDRAKANAIYLANNSNNGTLALAAEEGRSIYFHDPVTSNSYNQSLAININHQATDTGRVVFDGSDYTRFVDKHSAVYGDTTIGYGELALKADY